MPPNKQRNQGTMRDIEVGTGNDSGSYARNLLIYLSQKLAPHLGIDDPFLVIDILKKIDGRLSALIIRDDAIFYSIMEIAELVSNSKIKANAITLLLYLLKNMDSDEETVIAISFTSDNCILRLIKYKDKIGIGAVYNGDIEVFGIETLQEPISCNGELIIAKVDRDIVEDIIMYLE